MKSKKLYCECGKEIEIKDSSYSYSLFFENIDYNPENLITFIPSCGCFKNLFDSLTLGYNISSKEKRIKMFLNMYPNCRYKKENLKKICSENGIVKVSHSRSMSEEKVIRNVKKVIDFIKSDENKK
jgi:hypothetical protein